MSKATKIGPRGELRDPLTGKRVNGLPNNAPAYPSPTNAMNLPGLGIGPRTPAPRYQGATKIGPHGELLNPLTLERIDGLKEDKTALENVLATVENMPNYIMDFMYTRIGQLDQAITRLTRPTEQQLEQQFMVRRGSEGGKRRSRRHHKKRRHTRRS